VGGEKVDCAYLEKRRKTVSLSPLAISDSASQDEEKKVKESFERALEPGGPRGPCRGAR